MELPVLAGPNAALRPAIKSLATLKIKQDQLSRTQPGQEFLNDWMCAGNTCAFFPDTFMRHVLPFLYWEEETSATRYSAMVPVELAIGASIKGFPRSIQEADVPKRIAWYRENKAPGATASGTYMPELGVYFAHEGKHRIGFMRHHHEPLFQAQVNDLAYPSPDRLKIVTSSIARGLRYALLDDRHLQVLLAPHTTQLILSSYGVRTLPWRSLEGVPSEASAYRAACEQRLLTSPPDRAEQSRTLDLHIVQQCDEKEARRQLEEKRRNTPWTQRLAERFLGIHS